MRSRCLPGPLPWQRRQFSYWLTDGVSTVMPSNALIPCTPDCDARKVGGGPNTVTWLEACALWQSVQVAWRLLNSTAGSAASCPLFPEGSGCPVLVISVITLGAAGET